MSNELLSAVTDLTGAVENKVATMVRDTRNAAAEIATIKAMLATGTAAESADERAYRKSFRQWLSTGDSKSLREQKDVSVGTLAAGGYGLPKTLSDSIYSYARLLNPWMDPALCGVETVSGSDFVEPMNLGTGTATAAAEGSSRSGTSEGVFRECRPVWGEYYLLAQASEWARSDIANLETYLVREFGRQIAHKLALDIWAGAASGSLHGLTHTSPSTTYDDGSNVSPVALRDSTALQYISVAGSPLTTPRFSDVENLLGEFNEEYLSDPSFAIIMRAKTWRTMLAAESIADAALTMPRRPSLYGYPVRFCSAVDAIAGDAYCVVAGAWKAAYKLVALGELATIIDAGVTTPGFVRWHAYRRFGGVVRDCNAAKLLRCGA